MKQDKVNQLLQARECELHQLKTKPDQEKVRALLHDDFIEFGRSGQVYDKTDVVESCIDKGNFPQIHSENFQFKHLSDTVVLVTYVSYQQNQDNAKSHVTLRTSVWQFAHNTWQLVFHQGTEKAN
ncbi:nuclear transport factor 2 family protein [Marinicella gelatinilytica]|uniref:nuclear transport factor 2 family protein n=1 Tax=Marinicella gelatinilytica TaxID=2996017 RepID=UPI0022608E37|nr:nuclear transport factor 2 family protein [Marinicella gelatinilytica]MCX7546240.1 nuclear transport factor 2 family protein [Marinicella gelatinilytica]